MNGDITRYVPQIRATAGVSFEAVPPASASVKVWASVRHVRGLAFSPLTRTLWAATGGGVIAVHWPSRTARRYTVAHGVPPASGVAVAGDVVVISRTDGGLSRFTDGVWKADPQWEHLPQVRSMWVEPDGTLTAMAGRTLYVQPASGLVREIMADHPLLADGRSLASAGGNWYLATPRGLVRVTEGDPPKLLHREPCHEVTVTADGRVWAHSATAVYCVRGDEVEPFCPSIRLPGTITAMAVGSGTVWASAGGRLFALRGDCWTEITGTTGLGALVADPTRPDVWATTDDGLVHIRLDASGSRGRQVGPFAGDDPPCPSAVRCLAAAGPGRVYAGGPGGLWVLGDSDPAVVLPDDDVFALDSIAGESLFLARPFGVGSISDEIRPVPADGIPLAVIAGRAEGYVLTSRQLWRWTTGEPPINIGKGWVEPPVHLVRTAAGEFWLGTPRGVFSRHPDGPWVYDGNATGPLSSAVLGLATDGDRIWAATARRVWCRTAGTGWHKVFADRPVSAIGRAAAGGVWLVARGWIARLTAAGAVIPLADPTVPALSGATAILEHSAAVWVATTAGVVRITLPPEGPL